MEHIQWIIFIHVENARLATLKEHKNPTQIYTLALTRTCLLTDIMQEHLKTNQTASVWNKPCSLLRSKGNGKPELQAPWWNFSKDRKHFMQWIFLPLSQVLLTLLFVTCVHSWKSRRWQCMLEPSRITDKSLQSLVYSRTEKPIAATTCISGSPAENHPQSEPEPSTLWGWMPAHQ